ncbi:Uncharacterised protein [Mycolicibacterium fortuitum]|uniref:Uncharacterized protein n=1 Tax=Mycolicibacterium fortuitum TaxID=1766 RepID=A0A378WCG8_MYCFO|nr:Uncharacterised protein [Mycolicibacterium fortuitum]
MSIDDQINELKATDFSGGGTFKISAEAAQQLYNAISYYRDALTSIKNSVNGKLVAPWKSVGSLDSANAVKTVLATDQPQALIDSIDKYLTYLDEYENAVKGAYKSLHGVDMQFAPPPPAAAIPPLTSTGTVTPDSVLRSVALGQYNEFLAGPQLLPPSANPLGLPLP